LHFNKATIIIIIKLNATASLLFLLK